MVDAVWRFLVVPSVSRLCPLRSSHEHFQHHTLLRLSPECLHAREKDRQIQTETNRRRTRDRDPDDKRLLPFPLSFPSFTDLLLLHEKQSNYPLRVRKKKSITEEDML